MQGGDPFVAAAKYSELIGNLRSASLRLPSLGKDTPSAAINCWSPSDSSLNYTNNDSCSFPVADYSSMTGCSTYFNVPCQCYFSCHTTVINDIHVGNHDVVYQH